MLCVYIHFRRVSSRSARLPLHHSNQEPHNVVNVVEFIIRKTMRWRKKSTKREATAPNADHTDPMVTASDRMFKCPLLERISEHAPHTSAFRSHVEARPLPVQGCDNALFDRCVLLISVLGDLDAHKRTHSGERLRTLDVERPRKEGEEPFVIRTPFLKIQQTRELMKDSGKGQGRGRGATHLVPHRPWRVNTEFSDSLLHTNHPFRDREREREKRSTRAVAFGGVTS